MANALCERIARGVPPEKAVVELQQFAKAERIDGLTIQCIHGLQISERIALADGLAFSPPDALPPSRIKESLFDFDHMLNEYSHLRDDGMAHMAITLEWSQTDIFSSNIESDGPEAANRREEEWRALDAQTNRIQKAFSLLVLAGYKVALGYKVNLCLTPGVPEVGFARYGSEERRLLIPPLMFANPALQSDFVLMDRFQDWAGFWRLIERLSRARLARDPVDAHTDFGVIAESILTHGDDQTTEIGHRLGVRAAWLLGDTPTSRRAYDRRAKRLYRLRSAAAHKGKLPERKRDSWTPEDRADADALCVELLRTTLLDGNFTSDWESVVFGPK